MEVNRNSWIKNISNSSCMDSPEENKVIVDSVVNPVCNGLGCDNMATVILWLMVGELGKIQLEVCDRCQAKFQGGQIL